MLAVSVLAFLLVGSPQQPVSDIPELGPCRRIDGLVAPARLPEHVVGAMPMAAAPPRVPHIVLTLGGFAGQGPPYQSYPLLPPTGRTRGAEAEVAVGFGRAYVTTDVRKRLDGRGWSADAEAQFRVASLRGLSVSVTGQSTTSMSGDLLYQGPADVGLGMRVVSSAFLAGTTLRLGEVDYPTVEVTLLAGASRFEQIPELWIDGSPFDAREPLTQITRNPVYAVRVRSSADITKRLVLTGTVTYLGWVGDTATLLPRHTVRVQGGVRVGVWRWCSLSLKARWAQDDRGPWLDGSALTLGVTIQKR